MFTRSSAIYSTIFLIVALFLAYLGSANVIGLKEFAAGGMGLAGSFVGALFAYRLNEQRERAKEISAHKLALNKALFIVWRQLNSIKSLAKEMAPFKSDFERAFNCPAFLAPDYSAVKLDYDSLTFLLEKKFENLLIRLTVEEECYRQALRSLEVRSEFLIKEVQPVIAEKGLNGKAMNPVDFITAVGERTFGTAMNYGKQLHSQIQESEKSLRQIHEELVQAAKSVFPGTGFIKLDDRNHETRSS